MIWQTFDAGFTSVADGANGDNVILKILDYQPTDETSTEWQSIWKTLNNRNYVRGLFDRDSADVGSLPTAADIEVPAIGDTFYPGRTMTVGSRNGASLVDLGDKGRGVFPVGRRENLIRGSDLATAVAGSPGTLPGDMFTNNVSSRVIDGVGVQNGMNYVDVTLTLNAGASNANVYIFATGANTTPKSLSDGDPTGAATNLAVDFTWFLGIRSAGMVNLSPALTLRIGDHPNAGFAVGNYTNIVSRSVGIPSDGIIRPFSVTGAVPQDPSTKPMLVAGLLFARAIPTDLAVLPLRIGWPILDTTGWFHQARRGLAHIVPITAKTDTVYKAHRMLQPMLPMVPQTNILTRKKFTFVFDCIIDELNSIDAVSASVMPIIRLFNNNANQNVLTLCLQADNTLQGAKPLWFNILTSTYLAGSDGVLIYPSRKFKIAASLDISGLRWSVNGGTVNSYSDGNNTGISQYYIQNMMLDGTGYLFKRLDALYRTCTNDELQTLSR